MKERQNAERNRLRKIFWKDLEIVFKKLWAIRKLKKEEIQGTVADNSELDDKIQEEYIGFCQLVLPFSAPFLHDLYAQQMERSQQMAFLAESVDENEKPN